MYARRSETDSNSFEPLRGWLRNDECGQPVRFEKGQRTACGRAYLNNAIGILINGRRFGR
jgi:hypothetical protein